MSLSDKADDLSSSAKGAANDAVKTVKSGGGVVAALSTPASRASTRTPPASPRSSLSWVAHYASRGKTGDSKAQADRWGIFVGHWAPTFFALGVALKLQENS